MSGFSMGEFVWKQHCVPWRLRLLARVVIPWQVRRYLLHGRTNFNRAKDMDARFARRGGDLSHSENLYQHIVPMLPERGRMLDAGCGDGVLLRFIRARLAGLELHGVDFSSVGIARIKSQGFLGSVATLPDMRYPDGFFDCTVITEVLEHLDDPLATVRTLYRVTRPGGRLIASVPHDLGPDSCSEHVQDFTEQLLRECLTDGGFSVISVDLVEREPWFRPGASFVALGVRPDHAAGS